MDSQNVSYQAGGLYPSVDGKLIDEHLAYPKSPGDKSYKFFRSLDFMSGTLDGEGNMLYMGLTRTYRTDSSLVYSDQKWQNPHNHVVTC